MSLLILILWHKKDNLQTPNNTQHKEKANVDTLIYTKRKKEETNENKQYRRIESKKTIKGVFPTLPPIEALTEKRKEEKTRERKHY